MSRIKPWHIVLVGWIGFLIYAYPGLLTRDSYDQLIEARTGVFSDAHPPMMQAMWSVLDTLIAGPFGIILLQTSTFVVGLYLLARRVVTPRAAAFVAIALLWFPPIGAVMAVAWKDCVMAGLLALGIALLFVERRAARLAALGLLCIATAVRYNAFTATLVPIVLLFTWGLETGWRRYALAFVLWVAATFAAFAANKLLTARPTHLWYSSLALHDIVGTLYFEPSEASDVSLRSALTGTPLVVQTQIHRHIRAHYKPDDLLWIVVGPNRMWSMSLVVPAPAPQRDAIARAWKSIVLGRPLAYLQHRCYVFATVLGLAGTTWDRPIIVTHDYQTSRELRELGVPTDYSEFQDVVGSVYSAVSKTVLFRPYLYLVVALVVLALGRRQRDVLALLGSGLLVEASLFLISPSADYRYSHWLVVTTCIATIFVVVRRYRSAARPGFRTGAK